MLKPWCKYSTTCDQVAPLCGPCPSIDSINKLSALQLRTFVPILFAPLVSNWETTPHSLAADTDSPLFPLTGPFPLSQRGPVHELAPQNRCHPPSPDANSPVPVNHGRPSESNVGDIGIRCNMNFKIETFNEKYITVAPYFYLSGTYPVPS